jgi:hypothetical protein
MGLFTTYLAYRHGKNKAERRAARRASLDDEDQYVVCDFCGFELRFHADDDDQTCPQ